MTKFYVPAAVDSKIADEGRWFDIDDDAGIHYGAFKIRYLDGMSQQTELDKKRVWAKKSCNVKSNSDEAQMKRIAATVAYLSLTDWKLPTDPNDAKAKSPEFSHDLAFEYLTQDSSEVKRVMLELAQRAGSNEFFQADGSDENETETEAVEKN